MGECWLIPYGNECQFQIGYQGLSKILYRNPDVQNITSECVYENDEFEYALGLSPTLSHKPVSVKRGKLIAVYCVVRFSNQEPIFKVMTIDDLKGIQALSKAGNSSIWFSSKDPENWMLKKTCFKQLCKLLPKTLNMSKIIAYDNVVEGGGAMRLDDNNQPIVIDNKPKSTANLFEKVMEEDNDSGDSAILPGLDPKIKSANIHIAKLKEEKTEKIYSKEEVKEQKKLFQELYEKKVKDLSKKYDKK